MVVCNASDTQSRCARGCQSNDRRRRDIRDHKVYSLGQGPIALDYTNEDEEDDKNLTAKKSETSGKKAFGNVPNHDKSRGLALFKLN